MARIDLQRVSARLLKALHQELLAVKVGPLAGEVDEAPDLTYQQFSLVLPCSEQGAPVALLLTGAAALADAVRSRPPSYFAKMPMPSEESGLTAHRHENGKECLRVVWVPPNPIYPFGALELDMVGVAAAPSRVH